MVLEVDDLAGLVGRARSDDGLDRAVDRIVSAVDALDPHRRAHDRARSAGIGRIFVLLLGVVLVAVVAVTLNQLITDAAQGIAQGM